MKILQTIAAILIVCFFGINRVHSQSITLIFSGIKDGQPVTLDRIEIHNLDKGCDTTLYYPATSLLLQPLGIGDPLSVPLGFTVFQNVPNPAAGQTAVNLYQPEPGLVSIIVTELTGRQVASFHGELQQGYHTFEFTPGSFGSYLFTAGCSGVIQSIRIVSGLPGKEGLCKLDYAGTGPGEDLLKMAFPAGGFTFSPGDRLRYTGFYSTFTSVIEDAPQSNISYTFDFSATGTPCPGIPTVTYGGQVYHTVQIGTQCWFKENLNIGTRINGSLNQTDNGIMEKYCYDDNESNCNTYGGLYQWNELMQYEITQGAKGLCPDGWHIPTDAEWTALTNFLGGESVAGGKMKETGTAHWASPNYMATNSSGFTAFPGGFRYSSGSFNRLTYGANIWSSTEYSTTNAWYLWLFYDYLYGEHVYRLDWYKTYGFSCRCLQD